MADSYEIDLEIQGGEQPEIVMETEGGATDGASARAAEAWANGTRNGVPVEEGDPAYNKSSKYYRDSAAAIAAGDVIDDDAGHGDTMLAWSADKLVSEFGGKHEDLTAGNALFLLSDRGETDNEPYAFRKTGGSKNAYGREMLKKIVGGTVAWNQIVQNGDFVNTTGWTFGNLIGSASVANNILTVTYSQESTGGYRTAISKTLPSADMNHKYLLLFDAKSDFAGNITAQFGDSIGKFQALSANNWVTFGFIDNWKHATSKVLFLQPSSVSIVQGSTLQFKNVNFFDLTQMFGSTIADSILAMEEATAGSGVAWFRSLFPKSYYAYDAGTLMSVKAESHALTGFNQWDEEWETGTLSTSNGANSANNNYYRSKNYIRVIPSTAYHLWATQANLFYVFYYDANKQYLGFGELAAPGLHKFIAGSNCHYIRFVNTSSPTYDKTANPVCLTYYVNGEEKYEPYQLRSYPLANVELRGIPKWVDGQMVFDGDEYTPDGTVKRRYGIVDLGTLTWSYSTDRVPRFGATFPYDAKFIGELTAIKGISSEYKLVSFKTLYDETQSENRTIAGYSSTRMAVRDDAYTDAATFKSAVSGVYFVYELATPTTESADPYRELQISNRNGTEEFTDRAEKAGTRDVAIPVGTETFYPVDVFALIDSLQALILENISNS